MSNVTRITKIASLIIRSLLTFALVTPFLSLSPVFAQAGGDVLSQLSPAAQTVALAINGARAQAGLTPLGLHPLLDLAAQTHVNDMVANSNYSHTGSDGSNVRQRVQRTGYPSAWASENWVMVTDPSMAIQWWMNSTVHRANILNQNWHEFGIGIGRHPNNGHLIFVAVFAAGDNGDAAQIVMPPAPEPLPIPAGGGSYTIQAGDTLLSIGLRYGVEWPVIATANGLSEFSLLQIGQVIRIPGVNDVGGAVAAANSASAPPEETPVGDVFIRRYTVQPGDTLVTIANIYGLTWQEVAAENGLGEFSVLSVGKEIRIPGAVERVPSPIEEKAAEKAAAQEATAQEEISDHHTVTHGETIISIATRYGLDWQRLLALNNLDESSILQLGQELRIR